ncbi:MAG: polyprenol monophosphomannose synthase [Planctomycetota bacterium]
MSNQRESSNLLVIIATYNEIESLPRLVASISQLLPRAFILVIDDNSPDGTGQWCRRHAKSTDQFFVIHRAGKLGLGTATIEGLRYALANDFDFVATLDADFSHDPEILKEMWERTIDPNATKYDVMIGSRYVAGGEIHGWPLSRRISSSLVNLYARYVLGLSTKDNTSAFRLYRTEILRRIELGKIESTGYSYLEEILLMLKHAKASFSEISIRFVNRQEGDSKVNLRELIGSLLQILRLSFKRS